MVSAVSILLYATAFILGYLVGRTGQIQSNKNIYVQETRNHPFSRVEKNKKIVTIDERKYVTDISTNSLENKGKELGTKIVVEDDVGTSVSKLASLKKK